MAPATRKRKADDANTEDKASKKAGPTKTRSNKKRVAKNEANPVSSEDESDEGRTSSRRFFATAKSSIDSTSDGMLQRADELVSLIDGLDYETREDDLKDFASGSIDAEMASILCYTRVPQNRGHIETTKQSPIDAIREIIEHSIHTLRRYDDLAKGPKVGAGRVSTRRSVALRWEADIKHLKALNEHSMRTAGRIAGGHIVPHTRTSMMEPLSGAGEDGNMAWDMFANAKPTDKQTWGQLAGVQCKEFAGLLRAVITQNAGKS